MKNLIDEGKLTELQALFDEAEDIGQSFEATWCNRHGKNLMDTIKVLWKIVRAGQEHCRTHGHTTDNTLEDALIEAGLLEPELAGWRKKGKS